MLTRDDFQLIDLEDCHRFQAYYNEYPPVHSDYSFTNMISWLDYAQYHVAEVADHLIIMTKIKGKTRFRPPIGKPDKDLTLDVIKLATNEECNDPFGLIDNQSKQWIHTMFPTLPFQPHRDFYDYVYKSEDLAVLSGGNYAKIRNRLNKFTRYYSYQTENITETNFQEIRQFLQRWCLWRDCESNEFLEYEHQAILYAMDHFFELGLSGICIRIEDTIEALAVFEQLNPSTYVIHFEKGSPDYDGIYKAVNWETAKHLLTKAPFINRESDMGEPGLRKSKLSYRPDHMIEVYHIEKKDITTVI